MNEPKREDLKGMLLALEHLVDAVGHVSVSAGPLLRGKRQATDDTLKHVSMLGNDGAYRCDLRLRVLDGFGRLAQGDPNDSSMSS